MGETAKNSIRSQKLSRPLLGGIVGAAVGFLVGVVAFAGWLCVNIPIGTTSPGDWVYAGMFATYLLGPPFLIVAGGTGLVVGFCGGLFKCRAFGTVMGLCVAFLVFFGATCSLLSKFPDMTPYEQGSLLRLAVAGWLTGPFCGLAGAVVGRRQ